MNEGVREFNLVLSGIGVRGMAHIGLISALKEYNFNIEAISGNSIVAIAGTMFGIRKNIDEMHEYF